jgi:WD40 repeat protein
VTTATGQPPTSREAPDRNLPDCPYVGLVPFDEKDAAYFFGRERESDLIIANLTASRLTLLYAPSGVGKSSVLRASVLPRLHNLDDDPDDDPDDDLAVLGAAVAYVSAWRDDPLESIAAAVVDAVSRLPGAGTPEETGSAPKLSAPKLSVSWLREVLRQPTVSTVYLILDQFEEYFFYHPMDRGEEGLTAELGRILSTRDLPVHVLLSIREDALAGIDRFKGRVPHLFGNYLRLAHLSREQAHAAIEGPLDRYNSIAPPDRRMSIERGLIEGLLDQVRTGHVHVAPEATAPNGFGTDAPASDDRGDIETPYLQLVLTRLWEQERATGSSSLRQSTLDALGGAQTIVQTHLDNLMAGLSPAQVEVAAAVFHHLITTSGTKIALSAEDLAELARCPVSAVHDLLETLSSGPQRILRPVPPAVGVGAAPRYEIFHDVMGSAILDWRRRYVAQQQQVESSLRLIAEREKAQAAAQTARRKLRQTQFTVALFVILLVVISVFAYQSDRNRRQQTYLAQAAAALGYNPVQSLKRAVDAYQVKANDQARSAVLTAESLTAAVNPHNQVVAGPNPMMIGMETTPDSRHVVAYSAQGSLKVIGDNGAVEHDTRVSGLRGRVTAAASAVAVSPDASRVALGTDEGTVAVIDTATGRHVDINSEGGSTPAAVAWVGSSANGLVLVVSSLHAAATYSPETGKQVARFPGVVSDAVPLADEQHIVTSGPDQKLRVWDPRTGTKVAESSILNSNAYLLKRYGQSVVSVSLGEESSIVMWNWQAGPNPVRYSIDNLTYVRQFAVNGTAQIVIVSQDKSVRTYSLADGSLLSSLPQQANFIKNVASSPDGRWIATGGADGRVLVWFSGPGQSPTGPTYELLGHRGEVAAVSYLGEGTVMSLGLDGTVRRWELPQVPRFEGHDNWVVHTDLSRDGSWLVTAGQDGHAFIIDPRDLTKPPVATVTADTPLRVALFDPTDSHRLLTLGQSVRVPTLWSWGADSEQKRLQKFEPPPLPASGYLVSLAISPDGTTVAAGDTSGAIHLWDARTGALRGGRALPSTGQPAYNVAFDPTGQLFAATGDGGIRLWRLGSPGPPTVLPHPHATTVTFDPSGNYLVSTDKDGGVYIFSTRKGKLYRELVAHDHLSSSPVFSGDGGLLAVGTADGLVEVWDVSTGMTVMLDRHHATSVNSVSFLLGERSRLISASDDTTVAQFGCSACTDPDGAIREALEWAATSP